MRQKIRAVLDTNVFISAKLKPGTASKILEKWILGKFELIISFYILDEVAKCLKVLKYHPKQINAFISLLIMYGNVQNSSIIEKVVRKHKEDNKIIATAIAGSATHIVTLNTRHFDIKNYKNIEIVTPKEFINLI
jgi:putative PIN family toxin of toxin-antitoxin system